MLNSELLKNKVVLITGCNRGIGKALLQKFVLHGAIVYANARSNGSLDNVIAGLPSELHQNVIPLYFDVTDSDAIKTAFLKLNQEHKRLDCLVNNAGIMQDALIGMISRQMMQDLFATNVFSVIELIQFAAKLMSRQSSGSIINIASLVGTNGNSGQSTYSATKGAVISLTKSAAKELASKNIRVNAIAPGVIETQLLSGLNQLKTGEIVSKIGFGRMGTPEEVADVAVFLASDLSGYVTGQVIGVDGSTVL